MSTTKSFSANSNTVSPRNVNPLLRSDVANKPSCPSLKPDESREPAEYRRSVKPRSCVIWASSRCPWTTHANTVANVTQATVRPRLKRSVIGEGTRRWREGSRSLTPPSERDQPDPAAQRQSRSDGRRDTGGGLRRPRTLLEELSSRPQRAVR